MIELHIVWIELSRNIIDRSHSWVQRLWARLHITMRCTINQIMVSCAISHIVTLGIQDRIWAVVTLVLPWYRIALHLVGPSGANPGGYEGYIYSPIFFAHTPQKIKFQIWTALESERWRVQIERVNFYLSVYFADSIVLKGAWIIVLIIQQLGFHTTLLENSTKFVCLVNWTYLYFGESGDSSPLSVEKNRNAHQPSWTTQSSPVRKLFYLTSFRLEAILLLDSHFEHGCWNVVTATVTAKLIIY